MIGIKVIINSLGILLNIVGVWILFINSPLNEHVIDEKTIGHFMRDVKQKVTQVEERLYQSGCF